MSQLFIGVGRCDCEGQLKFLPVLGGQGRARECRGSGEKVGHLDEGE